VLTRAGFLHFFTSPTEENGAAAEREADAAGGFASGEAGGAGAWAAAGAPPAAALCLARCAFEAAAAPALRLTEAGGWLGGGRALTLRFEDAEEAMGWGGDVREAIAAAR
jgi:hypothetical protein